MNNRYCASLSMYDWPETSDALDSLWQLLKQPLRDAGLDIDDTMTLDRERTQMDIWQDPDLLVSQTCGFPYLKYLRDKTTLLGTPVYSVPGCRDGHYVSWILARSNDSRNALPEFENTRVAVNDQDSQSGYNALRLALSDLSSRTHVDNIQFQLAAQSGFFSSVVISGAHRDSLRAVADERADVCAIDSICLALARRHEPDLVRQLKIIGQSPETPSLPLIMSRATANQIDLSALRLALKQALNNLPSQLQHTLHLSGMVFIDDAHYQRIFALTEMATRQGITRLARDQSESLSS